VALDTAIDHHASQALEGHVVCAAALMTANRSLVIEFADARRTERTVAHAFNAPLRALNTTSAGEVLRRDATRDDELRVCGETCDACEATCEQNYDRQSAQTNRVELMVKMRAAYFSCLVLFCPIDREGGWLVSRSSSARRRRRSKG
jgi:hypothetical protein